MSEYGILDGHKVKPVKDVIEWAQQFEGMNRRVEITEVGKVKVSTVFLGLDHGFGGTPQWFETMVFGGKLDQEQERYGTWDEAEAGHRAMVARVAKAGA